MAGVFRGLGNSPLSPERGKLVHRSEFRDRRAAILTQLISGVNLLEEPLNSSKTKKESLGKPFYICNSHLIE